MAIQKQTTTKYFDTTTKLSYRFDAIEQSIQWTKTDDGCEVKYLVQDDYAEAPEMDDNLFLVAFHKQFDVRRDSVATINDCRNLMSDNDLDKDEARSVKDFRKRYHIFGLEAYIHGGVVLALSHEGDFCDRRWDVSQLGCVFVSKKEWKTPEKARAAALGLIQDWNTCLSGDVYGCVIEYFDNDNEPVDFDSCWGYYGYDDAMKGLKEFEGKVKP